MFDWQVINTRLHSLKAVKFSCLRRLVLIDCNLSELVLDTLECLEILDVRRNKLTSLPPSVGQCRRLHTLRVASNELRKLPDRELGCLRRLVALDCSFNRIKRLPKHIVQCGELSILEVSNYWVSWVFLSRVISRALRCSSDSVFMAAKLSVGEDVMTVFSGNSICYYLSLMISLYLL